MMRRFLTALAAVALFATALAPVDASARDRRGGHYGYDNYYDHDYDDRYDHRRRHYRDYDDDDDDNGDAIAAGVVGLVLGLAIGSIASQSRGQPSSTYYDRGGAYEGDYGLEGGRYADPYYARERQCTIRQRQWDRYANRYVIVEVPAPC